MTQNKSTAFCFYGNEGTSRPVQQCYLLMCNSNEMYQASASHIILVSRIILLLLFSRNLLTKTQT